MELHLQPEIDMGGAGGASIPVPNLNGGMDD